MEQGKVTLESLEIGSLAVLFTLVGLLLICDLTYQARLQTDPSYDANQDVFLQLIKYLLASVYLAIIIAYVVLFVILMAMIK